MNAETTYWKKRALNAESATYHAINLWPIISTGYKALPDETAAEMVRRYRDYMEHWHPDLIVRHEHRRLPVYLRADSCTCDPDTDDYDNFHSEMSDRGDYLCDKSFLGFICGTCRDDEDPRGPEWAPESVEWPCPPIKALPAPPTPGDNRD